MEKMRLKVYANVKTPEAGISISVDRDLSLSILLSECCQVLKDNYKIIFNEKGTKLSSTSGLEDGASLYLSKGEPFQVSPELVLAILGDAGVGKSAITLRYVRNLFVNYYDPTIEDYYKHTTTINGEVFNYSILDTAGMEDYEPLINEWIDKKEAILLVFSVEMEDSVAKLEEYFQKINQRYGKGKRPVVVLVGNKIDMERTVSAEKGRSLAERFKIKYYEVSAATGFGIKELFREVLIDIKNNNNKPVKVPWYRSCTLL